MALPKIFFPKPMCAQRSQLHFMWPASILGHFCLRVKKGEKRRFSRACCATHSRAGPEWPTLGYTTKPWWLDPYPTLVICQNSPKGLWAGKKLSIFQYWGLAGAEGAKIHVQIGPRCCRKNFFWLGQSYFFQHPGVHKGPSYVFCGRHQFWAIFA